MTPRFTTIDMDAAVSRFSRALPLAGGTSIDTRASRGIGSGIAYELLAKRGAKVMIPP